MNKQSILQHSRLLCIILLHTFIANISILAQENAGITLNLENVSLDTWKGRFFCEQGLWFLLAERDLQSMMVLCDAGF